MNLAPARLKAAYRRRMAAASRTLCVADGIFSIARESSSEGNVLKLFSVFLETEHKVVIE